MKILTYHIQTSMGELTPFMDKLDFLTPEQKKEFNLIGYTGKNSAGQKTTYQKFLNSLAPGKENFKIDQTKFDKGDFVEKYTVVRVILHDTEACSPELELQCPKCESYDITDEGYCYDDARTYCSCNDCQHHGDKSDFEPNEDEDNDE